MFSGLKYVLICMYVLLKYVLLKYVLICFTYFNPENIYRY